MFCVSDRIIRRAMIISRCRPWTELSTLGWAGINACMCGCRMLCTSGVTMTSRLGSSAAHPQATMMTVTVPTTGFSLSHISRRSMTSLIRSRGKAALRCAKRLFLSHFILRCIMFPRQARDRHRETSKTEAFFAGLCDRRHRCF